VATADDDVMSNTVSQLHVKGDGILDEPSLKIVVVSTVVVASVL
jgi:hypothetical protein